MRASWAEVGNDLPIGITNPVDIIMVGGSINVNTVEQRGDLKPEISSSIEFGTEWRFFHHRFGMDFTWYQTNTKNQLLRMDNPTGSTYKYRYVNAGKIRNQGFELTVDATPLLYRNFSWKSLINMSANKNKVVTLHPDYPEFSYYEEGFNAGYQMRVKEGGSLGIFMEMLSAVMRMAASWLMKPAKGLWEIPETRICLGMPILTSRWDGAIHLPTKTWSSIS